MQPVGKAQRIILFDWLNCRLLSVINDHVQRRVFQFLIHNLISFKTFRCTFFVKQQIIFHPFTCPRCIVEKYNNKSVKAQLYLWCYFMRKNCYENWTTSVHNNIYFVVLRGWYEWCSKTSRSATFHFPLELLLSFTCFRRLPYTKLCLDTKLREHSFDMCCMHSYLLFEPSMWITNR